jgi:3-methyladenine DNA glycosylase AlkD
MQAYQKNQFPFLGIPKPLRHSLQKDWIKQTANQPDVDESLIKQLWNLPEREYQYLAVDLLLAMKKKIKPDNIEMMKYILTTKPWWDSIDLLAAHVIGELMSQFPAVKTSTVLPWAHGREDSIWLRRTAILSQLRFKQATDTHMLEEVILANKDTKGFFLNKAIGWALREYAKTNPDYVHTFVESHRLHPLCVREALKHIGK